jgi:hypothetical protein
MAKKYHSILREYNDMPLNLGEYPILIYGAGQNGRTSRAVGK